MRIFLLICFLFLFENAGGQTRYSGMTIGTYYFDGWTGQTFHITPYLKSNFTEREPIWGWITSTQSIVDSQIVLAASYGIDFFTFCWYHNSSGILNDDKKNSALSFYLKSEKKNQLNFSLLIANHDGYTIMREDWDQLTTYWCTLFLEKSYQKANGKPLITFLSINSLLKTFGSPKLIKSALDAFNQKAITCGFAGLSLAISIPPRDKELKLSKECGFDIVTSYNNTNAGASGSDKVVPIDSLIHGQKEVWNYFAKSPSLYIPVVTLNSDQRPWEFTNSRVQDALRYTGFSGESVFKLMRNIKAWIQPNKDILTNEQIIMIYAWNEYGEGAWLTPSEKWKYSLLNGFKRGIK